MRNGMMDHATPSGLEQLVMQYLSANGPSTAEEVREGLMKRHPMKESTTRTILRRLEAKGYASHRQQGRTYIYSAVRPDKLGMRAIRRIIDRFWGGSARELVARMVDDEVIDPAELSELSKTINRRRKQRGT
jgi:BlaI family transcriptional regulator, penicillinase repressor